jgi:hypothetical protein
MYVLIITLLVAALICVAALMYALPSYALPLPKEPYSQRDIPVDSSTGLRKDTDDNGRPVVDSGRTTAPPQSQWVAPQSQKGTGNVLADYSQSLEKPYDDFTSPEPHGLEHVRPVTLDTACRALDPEACAASDVCVYVNGTTCRAAFSNTNNARAYNNYWGKTMPQTDLFYYWRDGKCYGDCQGFRVTDRGPGAITADALQDADRINAATSFVGILTPDEMYNKTTWPLSPSSVTRGPATERTNATPVSQQRGPKDSARTVGPASETPVRTILPRPSSIASNTGRVSSNLTCTPACMAGWKCQTSEGVGAICVPAMNENAPGSCDLNCARNYHCERVNGQSMCVPNRLF